MSDLRIAAQQALEALIGDQDLMVETAEKHWEYKTDLAIAALRAALAQQPEPMQEPVGEMRLSEIIDGMVVPAVPAELPVGTKLYAAPQPQRPPLTDEEIDAITRDRWGTQLLGVMVQAHREYARAIERKARGEKE